MPPTKFLKLKHVKGISSRFGRSSKRGSKNTAANNAERAALAELTKESKDETNVDELRRKELMEVMKDRSLGKEEKARRMDEVEQKYDKGSCFTSSTVTTTANSGNIPSPPDCSHHRTPTNNSDHEKPRSQSPPSLATSNGVLNLSAKVAANKSKLEVESVFRHDSGKNLVTSNKESYERQLLLDKHGKKKTLKIEQTPSSLNVQRRAELQSIMKDKSLEKDERKRRMAEVNQKYATLVQDQEHTSCSTNEGEKGQIRNNTNNQRDGDIHIDLSAKSYAEKPLKELESIPVKSLSERLSTYTNQNTIVAGNEYQMQKERDHKEKSLLGLHSKQRTKLGVNVDPTSFALAENGLYGAQREKKKSVRNEYAGRF